VAAARRAALDVEALVLPIACLGCQRAQTHGRTGAPVLCDTCRLEMRAIAPPQCGRCGQTRDRWAGDSCGLCQDWPPALGWAASAVWYDQGPARRLVQALKYGGWTVAAGPMAESVVRELGPRLRTADLLVPVPLGRQRERERGHNQAELLARAIARPSGLKVADVLVRTRETRSQTSLDPRERRENVRGAFEVLGAGGRVSGKRLMLIDDVLTTGATLVAAAQALSAAGAADVGAVTFARAPKPE